MTPEFWHDGASLVIYAAFEAEVAPLLSRCKLRRMSASGQVIVYQHDQIDLRVVVNGEAGESILLATGMALVESASHTRHLLVGTSGHASLSVGTWYHPSALRLDDEGDARRLYPALDGAQNFTSSLQTTRSRFRPDYPTEGGVDLETYHWFHALSRQIHLDFMGILRLVTDTPEQPIENTSDLRAFKNRLERSWDNAGESINAWLAFHAKRSSQWLPRKRVDRLPGYLDRFKWSQTQFLQVTRLLERARLLDFDLEEFFASTFDERASRRDILKAVADKIDTLEVRLDG